ncbi:MAG: phosphatase PAP2 family protein [Myxococcota bacterium]
MSLALALIALTSSTSTRALDLSLPPPAAAQRRAITEFGIGDYVFSGAAGLSALVLTVAARAPSTGFRTEVLFDGALRSALRLSDPNARATMDSASDVAVVAVMLYPFLDAALVWLVRDRGALAVQMTLMNLEAYAASTLVASMTKSAVGRVRPYAEPCFAGDTAYACRSPAARVSFISGHSASAFTAAGLSCAHHLNEEIYGDAGDAVACGASITAALGVGLMRIAADQHWGTDVLVGGTVGFLAGYLLPELLHYGELMAAPVVGSDTQGLSISGRF